MPHLSKRKLLPEVKESLVYSLIFLFKDITRPKEMEEFLDSILTETEKLMISKRVVLAFLLRNKVEESKIAEILKVTPATVSRMKLWIKTHERGFNIVFDKLEKERKLKLAKQVLYRFLRYAIRAAGGRAPIPF